MTLDALSLNGSTERDAWLQPVDALLSTFPANQLDRQPDAPFFARPAPEAIGNSRLGDTMNAARVRVYAVQGRLLGVAKQGEGVLAPERLVVTTET